MLVVVCISGLRNWVSGTNEEDMNAMMNVYMNHEKGKKMHWRMHSIGGAHNSFDLLVRHGLDTLI